jgi:hypothetical protein
MEIYNEDKSFDIIKKELNRNESLLLDEYKILKQMNDPEYNSLIKKYELYFNEQTDNNNKIIEHIKQVINYLNKDSNEMKQRDIKQLYKLINKLL